jgi:hypothetical protein
MLLSYYITEGEMGNTHIKHGGDYKCVQILDEKILRGEIT